MIAAGEQSATIVQCLLKCWIKACNECAGQDAGPSLESIFAEGENAINVEDKVFGGIITAKNVREYRERWRAALQGLDRFAFRLTGTPVVNISGDSAVIEFDLAADAVDRKGNVLHPVPRWRGRHEWRRIEGEWRIVSERLEESDQVAAR